MYSGCLWSLATSGNRRPLSALHSSLQPPPPRLDLIWKAACLLLFLRRLFSETVLSNFFIYFLSLTLTGSPAVLLRASCVTEAWLRSGVTDKASSVPSTPTPPATGDGSISPPGRPLSLSALRCPPPPSIPITTLRPRCPPHLPTPQLRPRSTHPSRHADRASVCVVGDCGGWGGGRGGIGACRWGVVLCQSPLRSFVWDRPTD